MYPTTSPPRVSSLHDDKSLSARPANRSPADNDPASIPRSPLRQSPSTSPIRLGQDSFDASLSSRSSPDRAHKSSPRTNRPAALDLGLDSHKRETRAHSRELRTDLEQLNHADTNQSRRTLRNTPDNLPPYSPATPGSAPASASSRAKDARNPQTKIRPSLRMMLAQAPKKSRTTVLVPAFILSIGSGMVPPFMTQFIGDATQAFTDYAFADAAAVGSPEQLDRARSHLLSSIGIVSIKLVVLGVISFTLATAMVSLWVVNGERIVKALRVRVFTSITKKELSWFDLGMGADTSELAAEGTDEGTGSGGLMGRFTKDTDDVRLGTSQALGLVFQYLTTFVACLALSFWRSWSLTLVVLASFPVVIVVIGATERVVDPLLRRDRDFTAKSSSRLERVISAVTTVKAFNAEEQERAAFRIISRDNFRVDRRLSFVFGLRNGVTDFVTLAMFVQGFWFGTYLVSSGKSTVGQVNTAFWACLTAATNIQQCVPMLVVVEKGKVALASLLELARTGEDDFTASHESTVVASPQMAEQRVTRTQRQQSSSGSSGSFSISTPDAIDVKLPISPERAHQQVSPSTPNFISLQARQKSRRTARKMVPRPLRKIRPATFSGELSVRNVTFYYPTRPWPAPPALDNVSLYLAARETTYIVGGSGSGKSTVGSLLLGLYKAHSGTVEVDEQGLDWIDDEWLRGHVACVSQGSSLLLDGTVHDNVASGIVGQIQEDGSRRTAADVTRAEVEAACRGALLHDFIRDLPAGYDTWLSGEKGASLSGGQRQRLAIARAWVRNPTVLILDEATSALDPTSRLLVTEAIKHWRRNKTTVVVTHDLSPIEPHDFVYVMNEGRVVEQGYRHDLEANADGAFMSLARTQNHEAIGDAADQKEVLFAEGDSAAGNTLGVNLSLRPASYRDSVASSLADSARALLDLRRTSVLGQPRPAFNVGVGDSSQPAHDRPSSLLALEMAAATATTRRPLKRIRRPSAPLVIAAEKAAPASLDASEKDPVEIVATLSRGTGVPDRPRLSFAQLARRYYRTIPNKRLLFVGFSLCLVTGACTPVFAFLLSKLLSNLGNPDPSTSATVISLCVLLVAFVNGLSVFLKYYLLERCAMGWVVALRREAFSRILQQDKPWFDRGENSSSVLSQAIVKDTHDARSMVATILGQSLVVVFMLIMGLAWAFSSGWELTLVGLGLAPAFVLFTHLQAGRLSSIEARNRGLRADISTMFHKSVVNVRAIRSMSLTTVFTTEFDAAAQRAYVGGLKAAPFTGMGSATAMGLTLLAEALMFYVGAVLIIKGRYTYGKMMEVFSLIILTVTFAAQVMVFLPGVARSMQAAIDFLRLLDLPTEASESRGCMTFPVVGDIAFEHVAFAYPTRASAPVLRDATFSIKAGDFVGIVGPSGGGKSTLVSLLQRLYEPSSGTILLDGRPLDRIDTKYLRDHIAVVSQHPALFDMTVADNIAYGSATVDQGAVERAARAAMVHDFIVSLPNGYSTMLGESASLISGGQAQRLQIARALYRRREILLLDECTSALDPTSQAAVMDTIMSVKQGKTTLIVTHKLDIMEQCDYLLVVSDGRIVEQGSVAELRNRGGVFSQLASSGEWEG